MSENEQNCTEQEETNDLITTGSLWVNTDSQLSLTEVDPATWPCSTGSSASESTPVGYIVDNSNANMPYITAANPAITTTVPTQTISFTNSGTNIITIFGDNGSIDINHDGTVTINGDMIFNDAAMVFWKYVKDTAPENKSTIFKLRKEIQELEEQILKLKNKTTAAATLKFNGKMIAQTTVDSPTTPVFYMNEQELLHATDISNAIVVSNPPFTDGYYYAPRVPTLKVRLHEKISSSELFDDAMEILK